MSKTPQIWGAGIAGLIAANIFQTAEVYERAAQPTDGGNHKALLRFRSPAVGEACGVEFRQVRVHKGLWCGDKFVEPTILHANNYSRKVVGRLADRSVWALDPVDRWIAPPDFYEQLLERTAGRVQWGVDVGELVPRETRPIISTIPMPALANMLLGTKVPSVHDLNIPAMARQQRPTFSRAAIRVRRWIIPNADVYQTVYVSDPDTPVYRVSITGNLLIEEAMIRDPEVNSDWFWAGRPFGLEEETLEELPAVQQSFGKIAPIDDRWRKDFIFYASHECGIFSLGRFGTWRNLLLDDVLHDCAVIKKMMAEDAYGRSKMEHRL